MTVAGKDGCAAAAGLIMFRDKTKMCFYDHTLFPGCVPLFSDRNFVLFVLEKKRNAQSRSAPRTCFQNSLESRTTDPAGLALIVMMWGAILKTFPWQIFPPLRSYFRLLFFHMMASKCVRKKKAQWITLLIGGTGSVWRGDGCHPLVLPCCRDEYVAAGKATGRAGSGDICVPDVGAVESKRAWPIFSARVAGRVHINTCETGKPELWQSLLARAPSSSSPAAASARLHGKKKALASAETRSLWPSVASVAVWLSRVAQQTLRDCGSVPGGRATQHWTRQQWEITSFEVNWM